MRSIKNVQQILTLELTKSLRMVTMDASHVFENSSRDMEAVK